jgi:hypothetical protein
MGNSVNLRDASEIALRAWNAYEVNRGAPPVIDFDCDPTFDSIAPAVGRLAVHRDLTGLRRRAGAERNEPLAARLTAHLAYLEALMGAREPLQAYVLSTQGCGAAGWSTDYVTAIGEIARRHIEGLGATWNAATSDALVAIEEPLDPKEAPEAIREAATKLENDVRSVVHSQAPYDLNIEIVDLDAYWGYWLDGAGSRVRMRINIKRAKFTKVQATQFALHEILGHGLQCASYADQCAKGNVQWLRMTSVHAQHQVLLEGLAQALPLFVAPDDERLVARVRLAHYLELVRSELHLLVNGGSSIRDCVEHARIRVPFWGDEAISDILSDRSTNPLLRSYLWAYPAGIDWFVALADLADEKTTSSILRLAYREPLTPDDLTRAWPDGPSIGGGQ